MSRTSRSDAIIAYMARNMATALRPNMLKKDLYIALADRWLPNVHIDSAVMMQRFA